MKETREHCKSQALVARRTTNAKNRMYASIEQKVIGAKYANRISE
jgi:hypothetical protein